MNTKNTSFAAICAAIFGTLVNPTAVRAQTNYYWNAPTGAAGTWNTATSNWSTVAAGPVNYTWTNSGNERANFGNTAGTVTLGAPITAYGLVFSTTGYTITGNTLTLAGAGGIIDTGTVSATISSILADTGGVGLTKNGTGTLTLSGANTFTGATNITAGVVAISNASALGTTAGATTVTAGAALNASGSISVAELLTLNGTGISNAGALRSTSGTNTFSGLITLGSAARINADAGTLTLSGGITGPNQNLTLGGAGNISVTNDIVTGSGTLTKDGNGTVTLNGVNTYTGTTTVTAGVLQFNAATAIGGAGTSVTVTSPGAASAGYAIDQAFLGRIDTASTGTIALAVDSANNLDFSAAGANLATARLGGNANATYSGVLTPNGTTYRLGGGGGTLTLPNGLPDVGGATNVDAGISGNNSTVIINGASAYTGTTTVNGGVLQFGSAGSIGGTGASITVTNPGAVSAGFAIDQAFLGRFVNTSTGTIALGVNSANNLNFGAAGANLTAARLGAIAAVTYSGTLTPNGTTYRLGGGGGTLTMANPLVDVGGATNLEAGATGALGVVLLPVAATYTGTTAVNGGTLRAGAANVFTAGAHTVATGAILDLAGNNQTIGSIAGAGTVALGAGSLTTGGNNSSTAFSGVFTGTGTLTKTGTGTLSLSTNSTWTGPLIVNGGGVLSYANQTNLNTAAGSGTMTLDNGTLRNTLVGNAGTFSPTARNIVLGAGGGTLEWGGTATNADLIIVQTGTVISGTAGGALNKAGTGIISVVTAATYDGPTNVLAGVLRVRTNNNVFPVTTPLTISTGAAFDVNNLSQTVGSLSGSGIVAIIGGNLTVNGSTTTTFSGWIANSINTGTTTTGTFTKAGSGTLILTGDSSVGHTIPTGNAVTSVFNPYQANFNVTGGTLQIQADNNLGVAPATATAGKLILNGGALSSAVTMTISPNRGMALGAASGTLDVATGTTLTYAGVVANNGAVTGNLIKTGAGTLTLTGVNTYTGTTTINGGTVLANNASGSATGAGAVTVATLGTLGGTGMIAGPVTVAGTLAPGASIGQLTVDNNVTFSTGSSLAAELGANAGGTADNLRLTGTARILNLSNGGATTLLLSPAGFTGSAGGPATFVLASLPADGVVQVNATPVTGNISSFVVGTGSSGPVTINPALLTGLVSGDSFQLSTTGTSVILSFTPVPEPTTVLGVSALAAGALAALRRRRR